MREEVLSQNGKYYQQVKNEDKILLSCSDKPVKNILRSGDDAVVRALASRQCGFHSISARCHKRVGFTLVK